MKKFRHMNDFANRLGRGQLPDSLADWTAQPHGGDGRDRLIRYEPRSRVFETFLIPDPGAGPRGADADVEVDANRMIWVALGGSGHLGRFDRSQCSRT